MAIITKKSIELKKRNTLNMYCIGQNYDYGSHIPESLYICFENPDLDKSNISINFNDKELIWLYNHIKEYLLIKNKIKQNETNHSNAD